VASGIEEIVIVTGRARTPSRIISTVDGTGDDAPTKGRTDLLDIVQRVFELIKVCYVRQKETLGVRSRDLGGSRIGGDERSPRLLGRDILTTRFPRLAPDDAASTKHTAAP